MTNNIEAVKALNAKAVEIGNDMLNPIIERGFKNLSKAEADRIVGILNVTIEMTEATLAWANGDRSYESWLEMYTKANNNKTYLDLDPSGRLAELAKEAMTIDLRDYFEAEVKNLKIDEVNAPFTIDMIKKVVEMINANCLNEDLS